MILPVVVFLVALAAALRWGRLPLRLTVAVALILAPMRGGLLAIADEAGLSHSSLAINALVPALVAALTIGVAVRLRPTLRELPKPLLIGWGLIAVAAAVNLLVQTVGLKLYGVGLAQYLVYPTLAIAAWPLCEPGDLRRVTRLMIAMGLIVAITVLLQAAGVESFIQAASGEIEGFAANRYAGITGSFLHTSSFLGIVAVLMMGELLAMRDPRRLALGSAVLAIILSGEILTFSRSGVVIAAIGAAVLLVLVADRRRLAFIGTVAPAVVIALVVGTIGGVAPEAAGARVSSGFNPSSDAGNKLRSKAFEQGVTHFGDLGIESKLFGEGLAATGNARKLIGDKEVVVESYYLKLLVETGVFGLILIGGFLVWGGFAFARVIWRMRTPWLASVAAAGLGLSLYNVIYPALETQVLALVWWMLLAVTLRGQAGEPRPAQKRVEGDAGVEVLRDRSTVVAG